MLSHFQLSTDNFRYFCMTFPSLINTKSCLLFKTKLCKVYTAQDIFLLRTLNKSKFASGYSEKKIVFHRYKRFINHPVIISELVGGISRNNVNVQVYSSRFPYTIPCSLSPQPHHNNHPIPSPMPAASHREQQEDDDCIKPTRSPLNYIQISADAAVEPRN